MKKIYSFVAALVVAMVVLVSCASENTKKALAIYDAVKANDVAKVEALVNELSANKANLTADECVGVLAGISFQLADANQKQDVEKSKQLANNFISLYTDASAKADAAKAFETAKKNGFDAAAMAKTFQDQLAAAQAAAEQAAQAAEAGAAEGEAAEGEAAEGEAE
jgi:hypothetical protein